MYTNMPAFSIGKLRLHRCRDTLFLEQEGNMMYIASPFVCLLLRVRTSTYFIICVQLLHGVNCTTFSTITTTSIQHAFA